MPQAKIVSEQELKRALAVVAARRFAERDRLACPAPLLCTNDLAVF